MADPADSNIVRAIESDSIPGQWTTGGDEVVEAPAGLRGGCAGLARIGRRRLLRVHNMRGNKIRGCYCDSNVSARFHFLIPQD